MPHPPQARDIIATSSFLRVTHPRRRVEAKSNHTHRRHCDGRPSTESMTIEDKERRAPRIPRIRPIPPILDSLNQRTQTTNERASFDFSSLKTRLPWRLGGEKSTHPSLHSRRAFRPSSMSFQKCFEFASASSSASGKLERNLKSENVPLCSTRWTITEPSFTSK